MTTTALRITTKPHHEGSDVIDVLIPDDVARQLTGWKDRTWTEIPGVAYGYSEDVAPGHPMHPVLAQIADFVDALPGKPYVFVFGEGYEATRKTPTGPDMGLFVASCTITRDYGDPNILSIAG